MEKVLNVAQYIFEEYKRQAKTPIDEMKLHKLLYFAQRESFAITGKQLFEGEFRGWKYGPVCCEVRNAFSPDGIVVDTSPVSDECAYIVNNVVQEYGSIASWKLSELSHKEISWKNSRKGLTADQTGNNLISTADIQEDAKKVRPYDHVWDMYYDEFEDYKEVED
ncbi:MAG: DUF4065 domain-containing protein [Oscillospiraceae bacterium]|nr:DUF4065 domain-containing protein [Oscillospiraceae bacterium]